MIYNIPYNQDFIQTLASQVQDSTLILPGKYLTDSFKVSSKNVKCCSYDDLFFRLLGNRISKIEESCLIETVINRYVTGSSKMKRALNKAINEFFYYGLDLRKLAFFNKQHDLLANIIKDIQTITHERNISLSSNALREVLELDVEILRSFFQDKPFYVVLPIIFSPPLFQFIKKLHDELGANIVIRRIDVRNIDQYHPQFYLEQFLKTLKSSSIVNLASQNIHPEDTVNELLKVVTLSKYTEHQFSHVYDLNSNSISDEFTKISQIVANTDEKKIAIVSRKSPKLKMLYNYLKNASILGSKRYKITTSIPDCCSDNYEIKLFYLIMEYSISRSSNIARILEIASYRRCVAQAQKFLLQIDHLDISNIDYITFLLEKAVQDGTLDSTSTAEVISLIKLIESTRVIKNATINENITNHELLEVTFNNTLFDKFLHAHISHFLALMNYEISDEAKEVLIDLLSAKQYYNVNSFEEYRMSVTDFLNGYVIHNQPDDSAADVEVVLLTPIEARFLSYDLVIICDLVEGVWPPEEDDHYFISEVSRKEFGYSKPSRYEVGYAARDFIEIICNSKKVIISRQSAIVSSNTVRKHVTESRFLSILKTAGEYQLAQCTSDVNSSTVETSMFVPTDLRNKSISSTSLEKFIKNPYLYSIEYNLKIKYLPKFFQEKDEIPSPREFGTVLHDVLYMMSREKNLDNYISSFHEAARNIIAKKYPKSFQYIYNLWQGKFNNIAKFMSEYELKCSSVTEIKHEQRISAKISQGLCVTLKASADRVEYHPAKVVICDYKTGQIPPIKDVRIDTKPQMPFEGIILTLMGETKDITLRYIRLAGSTNEVRDVKFSLDDSLNQLMDCLKHLYFGELKATDEYNRYIEAHLMRIPLIEHKN